MRPPSWHHRTVRRRAATDHLTGRGAVPSSGDLLGGAELVRRRRDGRQDDPGRPGRAQRRRRGLQRGAGRHDVVDHEHARAAGTRGWARNAGPWSRPHGRARSAGRRATVRSSRRRHGTPSCRATWRATSSAWSNPRSRRRRRAGRRPRHDVDALAGPRRARLTSRPARCPAIARRLRYLNPSRMSRTRPENGAATSTPSGAPTSARLTSANRQVRQSARPGGRSRHSGS